MFLILLNDTRYVYFAEGPKQALGYGLGSASQYLHPVPLLPASLNKCLCQQASGV